MNSILKNLGIILTELAGSKPSEILKEGARNIASDALDKGTDVVKESLSLFTEEASEALKEKARQMKEEPKKEKKESKLKVVKREEN